MVLAVPALYWEFIALLVKSYGQVETFVGITLASLSQSGHCELRSIEFKKRIQQHIRAVGDVLGAGEFFG